MENNPFYDAISYISDNEITDKFMEMSIMWDILTDEGKNPSDKDLLTVLSVHDLEELYTEYIIRKNGNCFDIKALKETIESFSYLN